MRVSDHSPLFLDLSISEELSPRARHRFSQSGRQLRLWQINITSSCKTSHSWTTLERLRRCRLLL